MSEILFFLFLFFLIAIPDFIKLTWEIIKHITFLIFLFVLFVMIHSSVIVLTNSIQKFIFNF